MAGHLLLVNPRRRRHRRRRMSALQRKYFGRRRHHRLSSNPRKRRAHHRRRSHRRYALSINPRRRRRSHRRRYSLRRNPIRRRHYRLRRNPTNGGLSGSYSIGTLLSGGAAGAAGGVIVNWLFGALSQSFPRIAQPGTILYPILKIGAAALVGKGLGSLAGRRFGNAAALGAVTVVIYNQVAAPFAQQNFIPLGRYIRMAGLGSAAARTSFLRTHRLRGIGRRRFMRGIGRRRHGRGVYVNGLGHMSPARIVRMRGMSRYVAMRGLRGPVNPNQASIPGRVGMLARFIRQA